MPEKITSVKVDYLDQYSQMTNGIPHTTKITVRIGMSELVTAFYPLNPDVETFLKISRTFLSRVERGAVNERKKNVQD